MIIKNDLKVKISDVLQWVMIYLVYLAHDSALYILHEGVITALAFVSISITILKYPRTRNANLLIFILFLLADVIFVRFMNDGGIGLAIYVRWISQLLLAYFTVAIAPDQFVNRFVKFVSFMALISLVFYVLALIDVELVRSLSLFHYKPFEDSTKHYGGILYTTIWNFTRNSGIYNEPGLYQIVLNTALFFLLFYSMQVRVSTRSRTAFLTILLFAIFTTQSTTGYLGMLCVLGCYFLGNKKGVMHKRIIFIGLIVMAVLAIDYSLREKDSLLYTVVLEKIDDIDHNTKSDHIVSSGQARMLTIIISIDAILKNPFGIGIDNFYNNALGYMYGDKAVAAVLFSAAAQIGVIPVLVTVGIFIRNTWKRRISIFAWIAVCFIFFNTLLAQCDLFYPALWVLMFVDYRDGSMKNEGSLALQSSTGSRLKNPGGEC